MTSKTEREVLRTHIRDLGNSMDYTAESVKYTCGCIFTEIKRLFFSGERGIFVDSVLTMYSKNTVE